MERTAKRVAADYKRAYGADLPALTPPVLSEVLQNKRSGPPRWPWVLCFVLTCHQHASQSAGIEPGALDLGQWRRLWDAACLELENTPGPDEGDPAPPAPFRPADRQRISPTETDYRIAVLQYLDGRPAEAKGWLELAVRDERHLLARELMDSTDPLGTAVEHAYTLGSFAFAAGDAAAARFYLYRAALHDHVDAAFALGVLLMEGNDPVTAAYWFNRAAVGGHEYAQRRFNEVHHTLLGGRWSADDSWLPGIVDTDPESTPPCGTPTLG